MARWHVTCGTCAFEAWIGAHDETLDAWCEACQHATELPAAATLAQCPRCDAALTTGAPAFEELFGDLQNVCAVLGAWAGDPAPLRSLLPYRPRFLADWTPPAAVPSDPFEIQASLEALEHGWFADAGSRLAALLEGRRSDPSSARLWLARATAAWRLSDPAAAETYLAHALEADPQARNARLDRGVLRARRGDWSLAREDFAHAGDGHEARWNRAALEVAEAVTKARGMPEPERLRAARDEAPPPSAYWSDHTLGRLLVTMVIERALARGAASTTEDEETLREAARELEFDTFWDRALVVYGCAALGMANDLEAVAAPLARELIARLSAQPFAQGEVGGFLALALEAAQAAVQERMPRRARAAVAPLLARHDLIHFRIPCRSCRLGTIGVDMCEEREEDALA